MYIASVIPIMPRAPADGLSYYSTKEVLPGSTVRISVGSKKVLGLVVDVTTARQEKTQIRKAGFSLKKIESVVQKEPFDPSLMKAVQVIAAQHARSVGSVLHVVIPENVLAETLSVSRVHYKKTDIVPDIKMLVTTLPERIVRYKSLVREALAKETSVIIVCPTQTDTERLATHIGKGIEDRLFVFTGRMTPKKMKEHWLAALAHTAPIAVVTTGPYVSLPRHDIGLFIVEHESSPHYKQKETPYLDARTVVEHIARYRGCDMVLGDSFPRIETLNQYFNHAISDVTRPALRQEYSASVHVVDMRTDTKANDTRKIAPLFSDEAIAAIQHALQEKQRIFLFCVRKGFAPFTICRDCGSVYTCSRCDAPMTLYEPRGEQQYRVFRCGRCGKTEDAQTICATCHSWRLESYGVGIEHVEREMQTLFPEALTFTVSRDATPTPARVNGVFDAWAKTTSGILLGTEMALPNLFEQQFSLAVIVSLDTLTFLPDFRMGERVFHIVSELALNARGRVIVQTRTPDYAPLEYVKIGDGLGMYRYEETVRKEFGYPPFRLFIKVTRRGKKEVVVHDLTELQKVLSGYTTMLYPAFVSRIKNTHVAHLLISLAPSAWPDENVATILKALPPQYIVDVDPQSLL